MLLSRGIYTNKQVLTEEKLTGFSYVSTMYEVIAPVMYANIITGSHSEAMMSKLKLGREG